MNTQTDNATGHTPGPWTVPFEGKCQAWQESQYPFLWHASVHTRPIVRDDGQRIGMLGHKCYGETKQEAEANARLIAAAPALLAACKAIDALERGEFDNPSLLSFGPLHTDRRRAMVEIARAAIALAETK